MDLRIYGVGITQQDLRQLADTVASPGWKIFVAILESDKKFAETLLLDHGQANGTSDGLVWKLKTDMERGLQIGQHKMANKYLGLDRTVTELIKKNGGN